jgi:hypothetical protein
MIGTVNFSGMLSGLGDTIQNNAKPPWIRVEVLEAMRGVPFSTQRSRRSATLRQLLQNGVEDEQSISVSANAYMRLACDLLGALFAP